MKLKISYSIISMWEKGDINGVIEALNGHWQKPNKYMQYGIEQHEKWEAEVKQTGCLPEVFGGQELVKPEVEKYRKIQVLDWLWLSGITDLQHGENGEYLVDYKTGKTVSDAYLRTMQAPIYKILFPEAKLFRYLCHNQYNGTITSSYLRLTDKLREEALEKVVTVACDIRATLEQMGMEDFDNVDKPLKDSELGIEAVGL